MSSEIVIFKTQDGKTDIDVKVEDGTVWLTQGQMVELFNTTKQNISLHIKNILMKVRRIKFSCQGILDNCGRWQKL